MFSCYIEIILVQSIYEYICRNLSQKQIEPLFEENITE